VTNDPPPPAAGSVDAFTDGRLRGWAAGPEGGSVRVSAWIGDRLAGTGAAEMLRPGSGLPDGYALALDPVPTAAELDRGAFRVEAESRDGLRATLPIGEGLRADLARHALTVTMTQLPMTDLMRALAAEIFRRRREAPFARPSREVGPDELSPFLVPVGEVSKDGAVVVGREGHLFLLAGSNDIVGQYRDERSGAELDAAAASWTHLFRRRADALAARGIAYRQTIVPEKSTVLDDCFPVAIETPTRLMARVEEQLAASAAVPGYVPLLAPLRRHPDRLSLYLPVDTHFAPEGIFFAIRQILSSLGLPVPDVRFGNRRVTIGDLGSRFPGAPLCAVYSAPEFADLERYGAAIEIVEQVRSERLDGTRLVTRNPSAPIDARLMLFGNSYFASGDDWQQGSWWMARLFREYHFHWSPAFDFDAIDAVRPDIVVGQTIERFLPNVPER